MRGYSGTQVLVTKFVWVIFLHQSILVEKTLHFIFPSNNCSRPQSQLGERRNGRSGWRALRFCKTLQEEEVEESAPSGFRVARGVLPT